MIIWSATAYPNKYIIEWKDGEFFTTKKDARKKTVHNNTYDLRGVLIWMSYSTERDTLDMPE